MTGAGATVVVRTRARRGARPVAAPEPAPAGRDRVPRVARVLALAHHWQGLIRAGAVRDQADLARLVGVSRARVTQVTDLLYLAPEIQEEVLCLAPTVAGHDPARHRDLRQIAAEPLWEKQCGAWERLRAGL